MKLMTLLKESKASEMAHKLGLDYEGYGFWSKNGKVVARTLNGYLVKLDKKDHEFLKHTDPLTDPNRELNKDDDFHDPDVQTLHTGQYYTGEKSKSKSYAPSYTNNPWGGYGDMSLGSSGGMFSSLGPLIPSGPPKQPKLPDDLPMEKVRTWRTNSSGSSTHNGNPTSGTTETLFDIPLKSWSDAPEKPKRKWKEEGKKEDSVKWQNVDGVNTSLVEPELTTSGYNSAGAGVVIMEPDGTVWVVEPTGHYAGYQHSLPKGTAEGALNLQENAIKEAYEEAGLKVDIVDYIGDVNRSMSTSRYYLAKRSGGTPLDHGWETYAVKLVPVENLASFLNSDADERLVQEIQSRKDEFIGKITGKIPVSGSTKMNDLTGSSTKMKMADKIASPQYVKPKGYAKNILHTKLSEKQGTSDGGLFLGQDGIKRYVKFYENIPEKGMGECLCNVLLKDLHIAAPTSHYFSTNKETGQYAFASDIVPNIKTKKDGSPVELKDIVYKKDGMDFIPKEVADEIYDGFLADVLTANWDVVGSQFEGYLRNIVMVDDGSEFGMPVRIDNGSAFLHRGLDANGRKPESALNSVNELQVFFKNNPGYQTVARSVGISSAEGLGFNRLKQQLGNINRLHNKSGGWEKYVNSIVPDLDPSDKEKIIKMMYARHGLIRQFVHSLRPEREIPKAKASK